jgi:protein-tyrosine phosphatase
VDFHNHLIPGVDDGASGLNDSGHALSEMQGQDIRTIITTPHITASTLGTSAADNYLNRVDAQWKELQLLAASEFPTLRLERGFEILLDTPRVDCSDPRLRLAGTRFVLVEFPWSGLPVNSAKALFEIRMSGYSPIVAHPERYADMDVSLTLAETWQRAGAYLQVNEGSLIGHYGHRAEKLGWKSLERGLANYLCSDFHTRGECPTLRARAAMIRRGRSDDLVVCLTEVNPARLLEGLDPLPISPLNVERRSWWTRLFDRRADNI